MRTASFMEAADARAYTNQHLLQAPAACMNGALHMSTSTHNTRGASWANTSVRHSCTNGVACMFPTAHVVKLCMGAPLLLVRPSFKRAAAQLGTPDLKYNREGMTFPWPETLCRKDSWSHSCYSETHLQKLKAWDQTTPKFCLCGICSTPKLFKKI